MFASLPIVSTAPSKDVGILLMGKVSDVVATSISYKGDKALENILLQYKGVFRSICKVTLMS